MSRTNATPFASPMPAVVLALLLAGCGTSPPVRYYALQPLDIEYHSDPDDAPVLSLGPLRMPEYLARPQMVSRGGGTELIVDDYHRWAEPLEDAIPRLLAVNVDNLVDDLVVVPFTSSSLVPADYRLQGDIVRFDIATDGSALLTVQWAVATQDGTPVLPPRRQRYEVQASPGRDADARAEALNDALGRFSRDIAEGMAEIIPEHGADRSKGP